MTSPRKNDELDDILEEIDIDLKAIDEQWKEIDALFAMLDDEIGEVELKTIEAAVDWRKFDLAYGRNEGTTRRDTILRMLTKLFQRSCAWGKKNFFIALDASVFYLKRLSLRPLIRRQAVLLQKLAHSAPVIRLVLSNRARHIFVSRPPIAPPRYA